MKKNQQRGFTLAELMVTIAIVGIIAAIAMPSFTSIISKRKVVGVTEEIYSQMQLARSQAILSNQMIYIHPTITAADSWCLAMHNSATACNCNTANSCKTVVNVAGTATNVPSKVLSSSDYSGVRLLSGYAGVGGYVTFNPDRGTSFSGNFTASYDGFEGKVSTNNIGRIIITLP